MFLFCCQVGSDYFWTAMRQASLSLTISPSLPKFMSIESVMPFNHLILCHPFLFYLQSSSASWSFPVSWLFPSGGQLIGASASVSVLPVIIQGCFSLGLTDWSSLFSKGLSRVFSSTRIRKHQFFSTPPLLQKPVIEKPNTTLRELENSGLLHWRAQRSSSKLWAANKGFTEFL